MMTPWATWCCISMILAVYVYSTTVTASNTSCPTWFHYSNTTHQCECGESLGSINCYQNEQKVELAYGFCVSASKYESGYYIGRCPFRYTQNSTDRMYSELPSDPDLLNEVLCGPYNRKGFLCGECIDGYGPAVYSTDMKCANCSKFSTGFAVSLYLFLEFVPITVFFICVLIFRINITAGPLLMYVIFCQICYVIALKSGEQYIYEYTLSHVSTPLRVLLYISMALSGLWSLQFFEFVIPPFCISEKLTNIHIHMLSLVSSIYPIVLVIITCILMELHARNYRIIHMVWKPFSIILNKTNITTVTRDAVIHAFATFILLSASTVIDNVGAIFTENFLSQSTSAIPEKGKLVLIDPTIEWLSHKHLLYAVIAMVPFISLVFIPSLLLCVYPTRIYRHLSRFVSARKRLAITAFAEALHNCFKDGLNGTRDYRALAGWLINIVLVYFVVVNIVSFVATGYKRDVIGGLTLIFASFVFSYVRPCKLTITNLSFSYHSMIFGILCIVCHLWVYESDNSTGTETLELTIIIVPVISHILVLTWAGYTLTHRIMKCCGYQLDLAYAVKQYFHRKRDGYQVIPDIPT